MQFFDENGEPELINHSCPPEREGQPMNKIELEEFSKSIFILKCKEGGYEVYTPGIPIYINEPIFAIEKDFDGIIIVKLFTTIYPDILENEFDEDMIKDLNDVADTFDSIGQYTTLSFACINTDNFSIPINGGSFFVISSKIFFTD